MKILIEQNKAHNYREGLFSALAREINLTVVNEFGSYSAKDFEVKSFKSIRILGIFFSLKFVLQYIWQYDKLVLLGNPRSLHLFILSIIIPHKIVLWGPWSSSNRIVNRYLRFILNRVTVSILYHPRHAEEWLSLGVNRNKLINSYNTVHVESGFTKCVNREIFLIVGTLNSRKRIDIVLDAYNDAGKQIGFNLPKFIVIGGGPEEAGLKDKYTSDNIHFVGPIYNEKELAKYYEKALFSFNYGQAGLDVLKSFGYQTPVVLAEWAISGGEKYNAIDCHNAFFCNDKKALMKFFLRNDLKTLSHSYGENAKKHYEKEASMNNYVQSFKKALL